MHSQPIIEAAALMEAILRYAITAPKISFSAPLEWKLQLVQEFIKELPLSEHYRFVWLSRAKRISHIL